MAAPRLALAADDERTASDVAAVCGARGVRVEPLPLEEALAAPVGAVAYAPAQPPDLAAAARLGQLAQQACEARRPLVMLAAFERARGRAGEERAAALAWLRAHGALVLADPDVWLETAVLIAAYGPPPGPRACIIAPPGGWLALQAAALAAEEEARGGTRVPVVEPDPPPPADLALADVALGPVVREGGPGRPLVVPVAARAELAPTAGPPALVGLRAALAAATAAGAFAERAEAGLGPAPVADAKKLRPLRERVDKALATVDDRLGDHEAKLLLSAYHVPVVRQAVATTPSAAVRFAENLGFPVEVRAWEPGLTPERERAALVTGVKNPPDVRRAFAAVASAAGLPVGVPVIVRMTAPAGRELAARIEKLPELGWVVFADIPGAGRALAAPAPLRRADADELAAALESSRTGDAPPDRAALAELLQRASLCAAAEEAAVEAIELPRIVVSPKGAGAVVVEARARLRKKRPRSGVGP
jgi:hypothetical protein